MESVTVDLFDLHGKLYLVMVDRYSGNALTRCLSSNSTAAVWEAIADWFHQYRLPTKVKSDNGPQFRGPFAALSWAHGISHETSSPHHPAINGLAEVGTTLFPLVTLDVTAIFVLFVREPLMNCSFPDLLAAHLE
ncbi:hypothetical protein TCAL_16973 [Tigriopus californicus]|uniref:Integrase catalytic domain-containing protein n=1 Tax=Tigriopus californicus TaxID=6832 RepID=A0A553PG71_TIGCA|nr:hypothetical protein TCAL_16973 [Tigriopus californicus]